MCEHEHWVNPTDLIGDGRLCFGEHGAAEDIPVLTFKAPPTPKVDVCFNCGQIADLPEGTYNLQVLKFFAIKTNVTAAYANHPQKKP